MSDLNTIVATSASIRGRSRGKGHPWRRFGLFDGGEEGSITIELERDSGLTIEAVCLGSREARQMGAWLIAAADRADATDDAP